MANTRVDETGKRYGKWTVLGFSHMNIQAYWRVRCDCGAESTVGGTPLRLGKSSACRSCAGVIHGKARRGKMLPEYKIWAGMIQRCGNPKNPDFKHYGGRGVSVCGIWRASFEAFLKDMGPRPSPKHSIDRIDNDGNYEPGNCRWADQFTQKGNRSLCHFLEFNGQRATINEWSRRTGLSRVLIRDRLNKLGWPVEKALSTPARKIGSRSIDGIAAVA